VNSFVGPNFSRLSFHRETRTHDVAVRYVFVALRDVRRRSSGLTYGNGPARTDAHDFRIPCLLMEFAEADIRRARPILDLIGREA
jgi:hypothetical protein